MQLTSSMCSRLQHRLQLSKGNINGKEIAGDKVIDSQMQELVRCVLQWSYGPGNQTKQTFLAITESYYYAAHCTPTMLNNHITKFHTGFDTLKVYWRRKENGFPSVVTESK